MRSVITIIAIFCIPIIGKTAIPDSVMFKILEHERQIMKVEDPSKMADLLISKSVLYKKVGQYNEALHTLNRIPTKYIGNRAHIEKAFNYYFSEDHSNALYEIWNLSIAQQSADVRLLHLMILLENEYWNEFKDRLSEEYTLSALDTTGLFIGFELPFAMDAPRISVVPGSALFKLGFPKKGFLNISLQLIFAGFGIYEISNGFYLAGTLSGLLPTRRFYTGGRRLAESLASGSRDHAAQELKRKGYALIAPLFN